MLRDNIAELLQSSEHLLFEEPATGRKLTYKEAGYIMAGLSDQLAEEGIGTGSRMGVVMENSASFLLTYLTCLMNRITVCPINGNYSDKNITDFLKLSSADALFSSKKEITVEGFKTLNAEEMMNRVKEKPFRKPEYQPDDLFSITFTSGSTGRPKAIVHKSETHLENADAFNKMTDNDSPGQKMLHVMPMYYMAGLLNTILAPLVAGGTIVIDRSFGPLTPVTFWQSFLKFECNTCWLSPTMAHTIVTLDRDSAIHERVRERAKSLKIFSGTAPLQPETKAAFFEKYNIALLQSYGLSETLIVSVYQDDDVKSSSVGRVIDGTIIHIQDDDEILIESDYTMDSIIYPGGEREKTIDGFHYTGDLGKISDGQLFITGRKKEIIIKGGENLYPAEIENVLLQHKDVAQAAVAGYQDPFYGENVAAFVTFTNGILHTEEEKRKELYLFCKGRLKPALVPEKIIFLDQLPVTPTGKIRKKVLIDQYL